MGTSMEMKFFIATITWENIKTPSFLGQNEIILPEPVIKTNKNQRTLTFWALSGRQIVNINKDQWQKSNSWRVWMRASDEPRPAFDIYDYKTYLQNHSENDNYVRLLQKH